MGPSYNNSFDGNDKGVNSAPSTPPALGSPTSSAPTPAFPPQFSSNAGDFAFTSTPAPIKKSKPWVIILIVFIIMALFAGIAFLIINRNNGGNSATAPSNLKEAFNSYINYITTGEDSNSDINPESINFSNPYFYSINNQEDLTKYVDNANEKFQAFVDKYLESEEHTQDIDAISAYYQGVASTHLFSEEDLLKEYVDKGTSAAKDLIYKTFDYNLNDPSLGNLGPYLTASRTLAKLQLDNIEKIAASGCLSGDTIVEGCYQNTESENEALYDAMAVKRKISARLYNLAINTTISVYEEIYNFDSSTGESNDK